MPAVKTECSGIWDVRVDDQGWILLERFGHYGERRLSQADAAALAGALLKGIRLSQDRNQIAHPSYYDSTAIISRMESPLGRAQAAVKGIFG